MKAALTVSFRDNTAPKSAALQHLEAPLLIQYATQGFEVRCRSEKTKTEMTVALHKDPHPSAKTLGAISEF